MKFSFLHLAEKSLKDKAMQIPFIPPQGLFDYTAEGSEFLDDAIRMREQPLMDTEEGNQPD